MKAVTYITENTIMKFLYNPKKTSLEGFVKVALLTKVFCVLVGLTQKLLLNLRLQK